MVNSVEREESKTKVTADSDSLDEASMHTTAQAAMIWGTGCHYSHLSDFSLLEVQCAQARSLCSPCLVHNFRVSKEISEFAV